MARCFAPTGLYGDGAWHLDACCRRHPVRRCARHLTWGFLSKSQEHKLSLPVVSKAATSSSDKPVVIGSALGHLRHNALDVFPLFFASCGSSQAPCFGSMR